MKQVRAFTDGACSGNPGPGGWGAILRAETNEGTRTREINGGEARTTNNRMELTAAIEALRALKGGPHDVHLHTDSSYVKDGISSWIHGWKKKGWVTSNKTPVKNVDLWQRLDKATQQHQIDWRWVKGHAGHPENERCDALAREAAEANPATVDKGYQASL